MHKALLIFSNFARVSVLHRYKIFWRLHARDTEWATELLADTGNVGMAVVAVPAANYYTRYDVKVQAFNEVGAGPESRVAVIHSAEDMPQVREKRQRDRSLDVVGKVCVCQK